MDDEHQAKQRAAIHWDKVHKAPVARVRWWQYPEICTHINQIVDNTDSVAPSGGFHSRLAKMGPFKRGVSIGCGTGKKEFDLLKRRTVQHFDLFEISPLRIEALLCSAKAEGLDHRISLHHTDAFQMSGQYDLVYWNNALHHMPDAYQAVAWSRASLLPGGLFAMDDFVGPSRWQWRKDEIDNAMRFRNSLPDRFFFPDIRRALPFVTVEGMLRRDPSEAADSSNILPAIAKEFPDADVIPTGGVIYALAMRGGILANFTDNDRPLLRDALRLDHTLARQGVNHNAVVFARK
jgi:SAM-dependent methyltransferase